MNIKIIKGEDGQEKEIKKFRHINRFNQMYKSLALSKEKDKNRIKINNSENNDGEEKENINKNKTNNIIITPEDKHNSKIDYISKINLPLLYNYSKISSKNKLSNNYKDETPSTSAYTNSTKNNLRSDHNLTEQVSKFRIGLFSANSSGNYNAIIPILPINRPVSNFNFGGNQLWKNEDKNKKIKKKDRVEEKEIISNKEPKVRNLSLNKIFGNNNYKNIFKSNDCKNKSVSSGNKIENLTNNNINIKSENYKFRKDNVFNKNLIEFKKKYNHFNKNNNVFLSSNGNKSHSVKKFI